MKARPMNINEISIKDILFYPNRCFSLKLFKCTERNPPTIMILCLPSILVSQCLILKNSSQKPKIKFQKN